MGFFNIEFENKELEEQYQQQQEKYILKCGLQFTFVLMIGKCLFIVDYLFRNQQILCYITIFIVLSEAIVIFLLLKKKMNAKMVLLFTNFLYLAATTTQYINYMLDHKDQLHKSQFQVYLDITHQFIMLINYGQSHIQNSLFYFAFLVCRCYLHISVEYTNFSITFLLYGSFYVIDQYQKSRQRRKLFLKSQRNKVLEKLIQEFIDEKVCIIEKDEENIRFVPIIINDRLKDLSDDINKIIKSLGVCQKRETLQNYLYNTKKQNEILLCQFKDRIFEIKYHRYILKSCQILVRMKEIYHNQISIINYKELFHRQQNQLKRLSKQSYQAQQIFNQLQHQMLLFWFHKYHLAYKIKVEPISIEQIKNIFISKDFDIIKIEFQTQAIYTDKLLFNILIKLLQKLLSRKQVLLSQIENGILIEIYGVATNPLNDVDKSIIRKILFHIGFAKLQIKKAKSNKSCQLRMQILNMDKELIRYQ